MFFFWTVFSKSGWKLIALNFAYNDGIKGRTWYDLYNRTNGKICSKFAMYPIRENKQDYIEWNCVETVGEWEGIEGTEPNITVPQYNETRIEILEKENEEMKLQNEFLNNTITELEDKLKYIYEKVLNLQTRPYIKPLTNTFLTTD